MHQAFNAAAHSFFINCLNFTIADLVTVFPAYLPWHVSAWLFSFAFSTGLTQAFYATVGEQLCGEQ